MSAPATVCRVVLLQMDPAEGDNWAGVVPAIVVGTNANGTVNVVALSDHWPLTAARAFRNVPHADALRVDPDRRGPVWLWPPRAPTPPADTRELEALTRALAALSVRVGELEGERNELRLRVIALERG